jgi:hypothetical protein
VLESCAASARWKNNLRFSLHMDIMPFIQIQARPGIYTY